MKTILVVCDFARIDAALQQSLVHLAKSSQVEVVSNGYEALDKMITMTFDLIIVDFLSSDIDSIELTESFHYIDPGVPVILMLERAQRGKKEKLYFLRARIIERPFNSLQFLRMADKLLYKQLNRYRRLATQLETILDNLQRQTSAPCAFLVEDSGHILISSGRIGESVLEKLGTLATTTDNKLPISREQRKKSRYGLYVTTVIENLRLGLLLPFDFSTQRLNGTWDIIDTAALDTIVAFHNYGRSGTADTSRVTSQKRQLIPLNEKILEAATTIANQSHPRNLPGASSPGTPGTFVTTQSSTPLESPQANNTEAQVNWGFLAETAVLKRLGDFCRVERD